MSGDPELGPATGHPRTCGANGPNLSAKLSPATTKNQFAQLIMLHHHYTEIPSDRHSFSQESTPT